MATQNQIDDLLGDSWCASSTLNNNNHQPKQFQASQKQIQSHNHYDDNQFEDYDESRRTHSVHAQSKDDVRHDKRQNSKLVAIVQQPLLKQNQLKKAKHLQKQNQIVKVPKTGLTAIDKVHLPHNYARLQERQRQHLLTTLTEENKTLRKQLSKKQTDLQNLNNKYKVLLNQKTQSNATLRQQALQKKLASLTTKLQRVQNLQKIQADRNKYKSRIKNTPSHFIPEEQSLRRQSQLLELVDKLKTRLLQSDDSLLALQKKINEETQCNEQMHCKMRRVQQLQYRIDKLNAKAENDHALIEVLKQKIKEGQSRVSEQRENSLRLRATIRRLQIGDSTNSDLVHQLKATRQQKQRLEKAMRELTANMFSKDSTRQKLNPIPDLSELEIG